MANDFLLDAATGDIAIVNGTKVNLCENLEDLTRQRIEITLRTYMGEWFANKDFGLPYFQSIFGKDTQEATDVAVKNTILNVEGVVQILDYNSTLDKKTRALTIEYKALVSSGNIIESGLEL